MEDTVMGNKGKGGGRRKGKKAWRNKGGKHPLTVAPLDEVAKEGAAKVLGAPLETPQPPTPLMLDEYKVSEAELVEIRKLDEEFTKAKLIHSDADDAFQKAKDARDQALRRRRAAESIYLIKGEAMCSARGININDPKASKWHFDTVKGTITRLKG